MCSREIRLSSLFTIRSSARRTCGLMVIVVSCSTVRIICLSVGDQSFSGAENSPNGTAVGTVVARDPNDGQSLSYAIVGGNSAGAFAIDPSTGAITGTLSAGGSFTPTITVSDGTHSASVQFRWGVGSPITITDKTPPSIKGNKDIRVRIPAGLNMTWDPTITTATITGSGASKVSTTVSYGSGNLDLVINVVINFAAGDQITVSGLNFRNFTAPSAASSLGLIVGGAGGAVVATDNRTKTIVTKVYAVSVSPHATTASQLPSNGVNYTVAFTVTNTGNGSTSYDLLTARRPGTVLTTVSIAGAGITQGANPDSARLTSLLGGSSATATVTYSAAGWRSWRAG